jgi:hypothetical protein
MALGAEIGIAGDGGDQNFHPRIQTDRDFQPQRLLFREGQFSILRADLDLVAGFELAFEQAQGERVAFTWFFNLTTDGHR